MWKRDPNLKQERVQKLAHSKRPNNETGEPGTTTGQSDNPKPKRARSAVNSKVSKYREDSNEDHSGRDFHACVSPRKKPRLNQSKSSGKRTGHRPTTGGKRPKSSLNEQYSLYMQQKYASGRSSSVSKQLFSSKNKSHHASTSSARSPHKENMGFVASPLKHTSKERKDHHHTSKDFSSAGPIQSSTPNPKNETSLIKKNKNLKPTHRSQHSSSPHGGELRSSHSSHAHRDSNLLSSPRRDRLQASDKHGTYRGSHYSPSYDNDHNSSETFRSQCSFFVEQSNGSFMSVSDKSSKDSDFEENDSQESDSS